MPAPVAAPKKNTKLALARATSDYLAVSRGRAMFSEADYERAEDEAWERLCIARAEFDSETDAQE